MASRHQTNGPEQAASASLLSEKNRLAAAASPYLRQHAGNPVDWYPWGEEAFARARNEHKPVFLSIGYSTCHWCHVMERESFMDAEVAALLNRDFVCIKVDREERPDLDQAYMTVTQALTGSGGWPMTVILTPAKEPFFAGTYFPRTRLREHPGLLELLPAIARTWREQGDRVRETAQGLVAELQRLGNAPPGTELDPALLAVAQERLAADFDARRGGFGRAPKFPTPHKLGLLLRLARQQHAPEALDMVTRTLDQMRQGGICDQLGGGFHRYATDGNWLVPHFEKMLYDQALIALVCLECYQATGRETYARTANDIFAYVARRLTAPEGGFYSAEDADSEGREGQCYLWTQAEILAALGPEDGALFCRFYNVEPEGNFRDELLGRRHGANILHTLQSEAKAARAWGLPPTVLADTLARARGSLLARRDQRVQPFRDEKILTDWNGLMLGALARAARVLGDPAHLAAARRAAAFARDRLRAPDGGLYKRPVAADGAIPGFLDDYAFLSWGLVELFLADGDTSFLEAARELTDTMLARFWDDPRGGLFTSPADSEPLPWRGKQAYDAALPSGNSVAALHLVRLARLTGHREYEERARAILRAFSREITAMPDAYAWMLQALAWLAGPAHEAVLVAVPGDERGRDLWRDLQRPFHPHLAALLKTPENAAELARLAPFTAAMTPRDGRATAYVCQDQVCQVPTSDPNQMLLDLGLAPGRRLGL